MPNSITAAIDLFAGLVPDEWRKTCVMPALVDNQYNSELSPMHRGESLNLFDVQDMSAVDVVQGHYPNSYSDVKLADRKLTLNYYKEVNFQLTGRDWSNINEGVLPRSVMRALFALSEAIDQSIYKEAIKYANQFVGTAGTPPFASDISILSTASRMLTSGKAPKTDRYLVIDEFAMQNARNLTQFREADKAGSQETLRTGEVGQAYGFSFFESNNIPYHTTTKAGTYAVDAVALAGATTVVLDNGAGAAPTALVVGDVLTIAGSDLQHVVTSATMGATELTVTVFPALDQALADGDEITVVGSHKLNLAFHKDSIAFASRPNADEPVTQGVIYQLLPDPVTGVVLDLRIQDYHRQAAWSLGCLWGVTVPPLKESGIVRILG